MPRTSAATATAGSYTPIPKRHRILDSGVIGQPAQPRTGRPPRSPAAATTVGRYTPIPERRRILDNGVIGQLNHEWDDRLGHLPPPVDLSHLVADVHTLDELEAAMPKLAPACCDEVLHTLLTHAADEQASRASRRLAQRTVLQLMLPIAVNAANRGSWSDGTQDAIQQLAVTCLLEVIATFPLRRRKVAANIRVASRGLMVRTWGKERAAAERPIDDMRVLSAVGWARGGVAAPPLELAGGSCESSSEELLHLLTWAVRTHVLDQDSAALLASRYRRPDALVGERPAGGGWLTDPAELAASLNLSRAAVRKRCSRAVARLQAAAGDYLSTEVFAA